MRRLRLGTQLAVVGGFLLVYSAAIALSYRVQSRAQAQLETAFRTDLVPLARLPRLGDLLRHEALLSQQYLLTGRGEWLEERRRALVEIRKVQAEMDPLLTEGKEKELWQRLGEDFERYLAEQEQWIERRREGRLSTGAAMGVLARGDSLEGLVEVLLALRDHNALELQSRRDSARIASETTFALTLATGALVGILLLLFVSFYVISPLSRLERYARGWALGSDWSLPPPEAGPEIESLFVSLRELARRLNEEYAKERDLARFKGQLVSMVSHEFNNALSIITGAVTLLEESEGESLAKRKPYFEMLKANAQALGNAAQNLLNMGKLESGKFAVSPRKASAADVVRPCVQRLDLLSLRKKQKVSLELPREPLYLAADPDALSLVVTNLVGNAIKYTPEGGAITVTVAADGERAKVTVADTGIGVPAEDAERIFSGYYRTPDGKTAAKGFGVGLSLARRIVEAHDGQIGVESRPKKGSIFWFTVPLWRDPQPQPQEAAA